MPDVILTGIPRSGTTLAAALIDGLPDAVCLGEPAWHTAKVAPTAEDFAKWLVGDFVQLRKKLLSREPVEDRRAAEGKALTNYYAPGKTAFTLAPFTRPGLSPDFTLAVKHNGPYLAVLGPLTALQHFTIVAIVRHPVEVIHSWRTLNLPVSRGEMPGAAPYWPRLAKLIATKMDLLEKQVKMYDLMCQRIFELKDRIHILSYENLIASPQLLAGAIGIDAAPPASLIEKSSRTIPAAERKTIEAALAKHGEHYKVFYPGI